MNTNESAKEEINRKKKADIYIRPALGRYVSTGVLALGKHFSVNVYRDGDMEFMRLFTPCICLQLRSDQ